MDETETTEKKKIRVIELSKRTVICESWQIVLCKFLNKGNSIGQIVLRKILAEKAAER